MSLTDSKTPRPASGWSHWKAIGAQLHADLATQHSPAHTRAILKIIAGELLKEECRQQDGPPPSFPVPDRSAAVIAQRIFDLLRGEDPIRCNKILHIAEAMLLRQRMGKTATAADKLYAELRGEFEPKPLRMILTAAARAGKSTQRRKEAQAQSIE